jgi:hypothetical protein
MTTSQIVWTSVMHNFPLPDAHLKIIIPCQIRKTEQDNIPPPQADSRIHMTLEFWETIHSFEKTAAVWKECYEKCPVYGDNPAT